VSAYSFRWCWKATHWLSLVTVFFHDLLVTYASPYKEHLAYASKVKSEASSKGVIRGSQRAGGFAAAASTFVDAA
jgi:hypothetical protein